MATPAQGSKYRVDYDLGTVQGRLNYARVARRLYRSTVAKAFGTREGTLKNWERLDNQTTSVPYDFIHFAAIAYDVPESWLLGETDEVDLPVVQRQTDYERAMRFLEISPETLMKRRLHARGWSHVVRPKAARDKSCRE